MANADEFKLEEASKPSKDEVKPVAKKRGPKPKTLNPNPVDDSLDPETLAMSVRLACDALSSLGGEEQPKLNDKEIKDQTKAIEILMKETGMKPKGSLLNYISIASLTYSAWRRTFVSLVLKTKERINKLKFSKKKIPQKEQEVKKDEGEKPLDKKPESPTNP